jgi:hypothetical protein
MSKGGRKRFCLAGGVHLVMEVGVYQRVCVCLLYLCRIQCHIRDALTDERVHLVSFILHHFFLIIVHFDPAAS